MNFSGPMLSKLLLIWQNLEQNDEDKKVAERESRPCAWRQNLFIIHIINFYILLGWDNQSLIRFSQGGIVLLYSGHIVPLLFNLGKI